jgi:hypothetical protein
MQQSSNMGKQSGCIPLKIDTQWRCFYYSMNTSLFLVSISADYSVIIAQQPVKYLTAVTRFQYSNMDIVFIQISDIDYLTHGYT